MPSFELQWTSGVVVAPFDSELVNPRSNLSPLHFTASPGAIVAVSALVNGIVQTDAALGHGFLFRLEEWPGCPGGVRPRVHSLWGTSARQWFRAASPGHYTVCMLRNGGALGRVISHLSVEP